MVGLALPLTAAAFLLYAVFIAESDLAQLMEQMYLGTEGIFGIPVSVSATYVMLFILFGAMVERTGTGKLFMDFAMALTGHTEIGRASCRERVCPVRVDLGGRRIIKKKNNITYVYCRLYFVYNNICHTCTHYEYV